MSRKADSDRPGAAGSPSHDSENWRPSANPWWIAASVMLATFIVVLDTSIANVALPHIAGSLSATTEESTWVLTMYLAANAIILPATGWLSNYFGRKRFLVISIVVFTAASAVCGAATSLNLLIVARVVQGAGGGSLQPIAQAVLLESFPREKRGVAMAVFGIGVVVAPIVGPILGGWLTDNWSWRWVFYINLPIGLLAILMAETFIEDPPYIKHANKRKLDLLGFSLMTVSIATLQIMLDKGQEKDWFATPWICWAAAISAVTMVAFIARELRSEAPIINLHIFGDRNFAVGTSLMMVLGAILYTTMALLPIFLQTLMDYPAMQSGLAMGPRGIGAMIAMAVAGRLIGVINDRAMIASGFLMLGYSSYLLGNINLNAGMASIVWPNVLNGLSIGLIFVPLTTRTMSTLRNEQIGAATGLYNLMRNIGGAIGISICTTMLSRLEQVHQTVFAAHVTPYDTAVQQQFGAIQGGLAQQVGVIEAGQKAIGLIYASLQQQATLLAFVDAFRLFGALCVLCLPALLFFRKGKIRAAAVAIEA